MVAQKGVFSTRRRVVAPVVPQSAILDISFGLENLGAISGFVKFDG
jgi:hypothetical protein